MILIVTFRLCLHTGISNRKFSIDIRMKPYLVYVNPDKTFTLSIVLIHITFSIRCFKRKYMILTLYYILLTFILLKSDIL